MPATTRGHAGPVQTFRQRQFQERTPFAFGHAGKFIHHGFSERIGGPKEFHILLRPTAAEDIGGIEARISRRDEVLCFRHEVVATVQGKIVVLAAATSPCCIGPYYGRNVPEFGFVGYSEVGEIFTLFRVRVVCQTSANPQIRRDTSSDLRPISNPVTDTQVDTAS